MSSRVIIGQSLNSKVIMADESFPTCPCGSGKSYEECCYRTKGPDGQPLFFRGAFKSNDSGKTWHPIPNAALSVIVVGRGQDIHRKRATLLLETSALPIHLHQKFSDLYAVFYQSHEELLRSLLTPKGTNVAFQIDTTTGRRLWKDFLFQGRILIDFLGLHSRQTLNLKADVGGLNARTFKLILATLRELGAMDDKYLQIEAQLLPLLQDILDFIDVRDKEKTPYDTIIEFPAIDHQGRVIMDGKIHLNDRITDMLDFINRSVESIDRLTPILLGSTMKELSGKS